MEDYEVEIIELEDETGAITKFELLLTFEYAENFYIALLPAEEVEGVGEDEVVLLRVEGEGDDEVILPIETEEELEGAWNAFMEEYYEGEEEEE